MSLFTPVQQAVLRAAAEAVFQRHGDEEVAEMLAALPPDASPAQADKARVLVASGFSDVSGAFETLENKFRDALSDEKLTALRLVLSALSTRAGTLALTGHVTAFVDLTVSQREAVFKRWSSSGWLVRRQAFRALVPVCLLMLYNDFDDIALATGYPALGDPLRGLEPSRVRSHYPFKFELPTPLVHTDVLVIGSGAGGGVVSSQLAQKGWKVLVVDKGTYVRAEDIKGTAKHGFEVLYERKGIVSVDDASMSVLSASTFGGGTTVNWSASLAPQHFVREEWAKEHGLEHFLSPEFTESIAFVKARMGVSTTALKHSLTNQKFVDAAVKLGYHVEDIPQNTGGHAHADGFCSFGCTSAEKQGGTVTWLKDTAEAGGKFMVGTSIERLLFAKSRPSTSAPPPTLSTLNNFTYSASQRPVCIGAVLKYADGSLGIVLAKEAVVVSAGSIHSPAILMRSGLKNPRIGKNLRLHPAGFVTGWYKESINPWEGAIMTAISTVAENRDGSHYGVKMEVNMSFPGGTAASFAPWTSSKEHKQLMLQFSHSFTIIAITRDRDSGYISLNKDGSPQMHYTISEYDGLSMLAGLIAGSEMHLAAGARRITTAQAGVEDYIVEEGHSGLTDPKWLAWIAKVKKVGVVPAGTAIGGAHQMGSCQMGIKASTSVVDPRGRVWGTEGLYVADASVFPTSSGVNPMITTMSTAHSISQFIDTDLRQNAAEPAQAVL